MRLEITLLGSFQAFIGGEPVTSFASNKSRALLAYLAAESDRPQRREALADLLWPDWPQKSAMRNLSYALANLRKILGDREARSPILIVSRDSLQINRESDIWVDTWEFDEKTHDPQADSDHLKSSVELYHGSFLEGFSLPDSAPFEEWLDVRREAYKRRMLQAMHTLVELHTDRREYDRALAYTHHQLELEPWLEEAHQQLIRLLAFSGRRSAALAQYKICRKALKDELGVGPGSETIALYEQIRDGRLEVAEVKEMKNEEIPNHPSPPVHTTPPSRTDNLPTPSAGLVGRQQELERLCDLLDNPDCRLATILGGGGSGKSRLALEAGRSLLPLFPDGVFWVELDTLQTDRSLAPLVCAALDLKVNPAGDAFGETGRVDLQNELIAYLHHKKLLLVLDGFEGMLDEANLVTNLLSRAPQLKILVTSRALLNLQHEYVFPLDGLDYPSTLDDNQDIHQYSAMVLFEQAARRSVGNFELPQASQGAVVDICRLLEGLPLGILLAAAWIKILTPDQILEEMQRSLEILSADWRDLPDRQHSLTATFEYSFSLLPEPEKTAFLRLGVFRSPFTSARAAQIAGVSILSLKRLVDRSLLQRSGEDRFHMHDLLRQYAQEKLAGDPVQDLEAHHKHCRVFLEALAAWEPRLRSPDLSAAQDEMDLEYGDLLAAWNWGLEKNQFSLLERAIEAFRHYHFLRSLHHEKGILCQKALTRMETVGINEHNLHLWLRLANWYYDYLEERRGFQQSLDWILQVEERLQHISFYPEDFNCELAILTLRKSQALRQLNGDLTLIQELWDRSLELAYECGDPYTICHVMDLISFWQVSIHQKLKLAQSALEIARHLGDPSLINIILTDLAYPYMLSGDYHRALQILEERESIRQQWNHFLNERDFIIFKGNALASAGQYLQSRLVFEEALRLAELSSEDLYFQKNCRQSLHAIFLALGDYEAVLTNQVFAGDGMDERDRIITSLDRGCAHLVFQRWEQAEQELIHFQKFCETGNALIALGMPLALLGYIFYKRGNLESAGQYLIQALENGLESGHFMVLHYTLAVISSMLCEKGDLSDGAELYTVAFAHPAIKNSCFMQDAFGKFIDPLVAQLPPEVLQAAQERGQQMSREEAAQEWLQRLRNEPDLLSPKT